MRSPWVGVFAAIALSTSACTSEASTPIDLDAPTTTAGDVGPPDLPEDDPNAEARNQVIELAKEECRKDPTAEFGTVIIADENGVEVNRYEHPCDEVRAEDGEGSTGSE